MKKEMNDTIEYKGTIIDIEKIKWNYRFAFRNGKIEPILVFDAVKKKNNLRIYYVFLEDFEKKFCSFENINDVLFETEQSAKQFINNKCIVKTEKKEQKERDCQRKKYYIFDSSNNMYFRSFHKSTFFADVPDFTLSVQHAQTFFSYSGAQSVLEKIMPVISGLKIVEETELANLLKNTELSNDK